MDIKYKIKDTELIFSEIIEFYEGATTDFNEYQNKIEGHELLKKIFGNKDYEISFNNFEIGDIKKAKLKNNYNFNGVPISCKYIVELHFTGEIKNCKNHANFYYFDLYIPKFSSIWMDKFGDIYKVELSKGININNDYIPKNKVIYLLPINDEYLNESYENAIYEGSIFTIESYNFIKKNHHDGGIYLGYYRREKNRFGSLSSYDNYDNDIPSFPFCQKKI